VNDLIWDPGIRKICDLVERRIGLLLGPGKQYLVRQRLQSRLAAFGFSDFTQYHQHLLDPTRPEWTEVVHALTTHTTGFFRENNQFEFLERKVLPVLKEKQTTVRIWSAACSTGEEVYSLAISVDRAGLFSQAGLHVDILGSDVDCVSLEVAKLGRYEKEKLHSVDSPTLRDYFKYDVKNGLKAYQVNDDILEKVHFQGINIFESFIGINGNIDVIFCRNVLVYFSNIEQERIIAKLVDMLAVGGFLFLGHAESANTRKLPLIVAAPAVYQKV
jgi:chemotaxis protein methyltransferase CheR